MSLSEAAPGSAIPAPSGHSCRQGADTPASLDGFSEIDTGPQRGRRVHSVGSVGGHCFGVEGFNRVYETELLRARM